MKKTEEPADVTISEIHTVQMDFCIVGKSPLVPHAMSAKNAGALLFPAPKKTATEKATSMKHEPGGNSGMRVTSSAMKTMLRPDCTCPGPRFTPHSRLLLSIWLAQKKRKSPA